MMKKLRFTIFLTFLFFSGAWADQGGNDTFGYMWTDSKAPGKLVSYDFIDARDGTGIFSGSYDDAVSAAIPLPFEFTYYGMVQNTIYVSTNGFITFRNPSSNSYPGNAAIPTSALPDSILAPYWDNIYGSTTRNAYYKTIGTVPNRQFVIMWDYFNVYFDGGRITFEIVLYETSNLIKFQYSQADGTSGGSATVGIEGGTGGATQGIQYSLNTGGSIISNSAILFHPQNLGPNVSASITPNSAPAGSFTEFTYSFYNIDPDSVTGMGKIDRVAIANPFTGVSTPVVTSIQINDSLAFIQNSSIKPTQPGFATWYRKTGAPLDSLIIQTSNFDVRDTLKIVFGLSMPNTTSTGNNFASTFDARLDLTAAQNATNDGWAVDVDPAVPHHFVKLSSETPLTVGTVRTLSIRLEDQFNNIIFVLLNLIIVHRYFSEKSLTSWIVWIS